MVTEWQIIKELVMKDIYKSVSEHLKDDINSGVGIEFIIDYITEYCERDIRSLVVTRYLKPDNEIGGTFYEVRINKFLEKIYTKLGVKITTHESLMEIKL